MDMVFNRQVHLDLLTASKQAAAGAAGPLNGAKLALSITNINPSPETPLGSYGTASFTGYAEKSITWLEPSVADDGTPELVGTVTEWRPTDAVTPETIYILLLKTSGGALYAAGRFDGAPLPMAGPLDQIIPTIRIRLTPTGPVAVVS